MAKYQTLTTIAEIEAVIDSQTNYSAYARLKDGHDVPLYAKSAVRFAFNVVQINAGEWSPSKNGYLNEEWVTPRFVYMKHWCDGCHYPPDMCCLQGVSDDDDEGAEEALYAMPRVIPIVIEE